MSTDLDKVFEASAIEQECGVVVCQILALAKEKGASACQVSVRVSLSYDVMVRQGMVETFESANAQEVGIEVYLGQQSASVHCADFSSVALNDTVEKAIQMAKLLEPDPYAGLPDPKLLVQEVMPLSLYVPPVMDWNATIDTLKQLEALGLNAEAIENSEGAGYQLSLSLTLLANSDGLWVCVPKSNYSMSLSLIAGKGEGMQRDGEYTTARDPRKLMGVDLLAQLAIEKTRSCLSPQSLSARKTDVIFEASLARSLLRHFTQAIGGRSLYLKQSFLLDKMGESLFPTGVNIIQYPHLHGELGSSVCDAEGVATTERAFCEDGILTSYSLGSYSARRLGLSSTGNAGGVFNLRLSHPKVLSRTAMLKAMGSGLLVTELMGQGVQLVSGDYSRGARGFWVENGEIQYPVQGITLGGNLKSIFAQLQAQGEVLDKRGSLHAGDWWVSGLTVGGG